MKDSKEKEHRISNLKNMIKNVKDDGIGYDDMEEDSELIDYLNEDSGNLDDLEINDEFIYRPSDEQDYAINLEENPIDENYIIKTSNTGANKNNPNELEELGVEVTGEISENFDNVVNAQVGGKPLIGIVSTLLGAVLVILSIFILDSRSEKVVDNVVSGETNFIFVIFFIIGLLLLLYGVIKVFRIRNPIDNITKGIDSVESDDKDTAPNHKKEPSANSIPKSNIPLDKESYKIGEFEMGDLKKSLKKPATSKKSTVTFKERLDDIPPAKEKPAERKGLTAEEIEEREYEQAKLDNESIDDIFAEVEDIEDIPIISIDSQEDNKKE